MKKDNIKQQLSDYYRKIKNKSLQTTISEDDIDDNLIAKYVEETATPEEIKQLKKQAETNDELRILLQDINSTEQDIKSRFSTSKNSFLKIFSFPRPQIVKLIPLAACITIIITGYFFISSNQDSDSIDQPDMRQYIPARGSDSVVKHVITRGVNTHTITNDQQSTNSFEEDLSVEEK